MNAKPTPNYRQIRGSDITPPPELVQEWFEEASRDGTGWPSKVAIAAAKWGADQELEACCVEVSFWGSKSMTERIRAARRSKPPSLKEQALKELQMAYDTSDISMVHLDTIRRALESINEDDEQDD